MDHALSWAVYPCFSHSWYIVDTDMAVQVQMLIPVYWYYGIAVR